MENTPNKIALFHRKLGSRWIPNVSEIDTNNMKSTRRTLTLPLCTQRKLYSIDSHRLALGIYRLALDIIGLCWTLLGVALGPLGFLYTCCIGNANPSRWGPYPTQRPIASGFTLQWNIGFRLCASFPDQL